MRKKKQSKANFLRSWGMQVPPCRPSQLRYKNPPEKGIYWYWFSLDIRQRDVDKYGTCISCDKPITVETSQAGHFVAAHGCGRDLLFDRRNVNAECPGCNGKDQNHLLGYEKNLNERYGPDTTQGLKQRFFDYKNSSVPLKDFKGSEYADKIKALKYYQEQNARHSVLQ